MIQRTGKWSAACSSSHFRDPPAHPLPFPRPLKSLSVVKFLTVVLFRHSPHDHGHPKPILLSLEILFIILNPMFPPIEYSSSAFRFSPNKLVTVYSNGRRPLFHSILQIVSSTGSGSIRQYRSPSTSQNKSARGALRHIGGAYLLRKCHVRRWHDATG